MIAVLTPDLVASINFLSVISCQALKQYKIIVKVTAMFFYELTHADPIVGLSTRAFTIEKGR